MFCETYNVAQKGVVYYGAGYTHTTGSADESRFGDGNCQPRQRFHEYPLPACRADAEHDHLQLQLSSCASKLDNMPSNASSAAIHASVHSLGFLQLEECPIALEFYHGKDG